MQESIILEQILFLTILVLIGFFSSRIGVIKEATRDALVKIIFNITLPLMLFTNFSKLDLNPAILKNSLVVMLISFVVILLMLLFGYIFAGFFKMKHEQKSIFIAHHGFGNVVYFGFPVVNALYGEMGLLYASIYTFVSIMMLWTVGVFIISRKGGTGFRDSLNKMINPNSVAILAGFILFLLQIRIPELILKPFISLGGTTIYLSMLYIGALLGLMKLKGVLSNKLVIFTSLNKNILLPGLLVLILSLFTKNILSGIDQLIISVIIIEAAMPCMANVVIIAKIFNVDDRLATANVFISTVLSIISLPLIYWLLMRII